MAATVVSVVIFLCGVLVGRGVRAERAVTVSDAAIGAVPDLPAEQPAPPPAAGSDPTKAAPPPAVDELSYYSRLEKTTPAVEDLKPARGKAAAPEPAQAAPPPEKSAPPAKTAAKPAALPAPDTSATPPAPTEAAAAPAEASAEPSGPGYAVQVAALNVRNEADVIAKRLTSKGYAAYVLAPASGTPRVFRVRVGKFGTKREADTVAAKLQKEEQFKPWVTR